MYNSDEVILDTKKYLKKLMNTVMENSSFTFAKTKIVKKKAIDDILCCVEAVMPQEYRNYVRTYGTAGLKSHLYLSKIHAAIKNKFLLSTDVYSVRYKELEPLMSAFVSELRHDLDKISQSSL